MPLVKSSQHRNSIFSEWTPYVPFYIAALILTIIVAGIDQVTHPLHPDNAFHTYAAKMIIENGSVHDYFFDANPPLFAYLMTIPVLLNSILGISIVFWYKSFVFIVIGLSFLGINKELGKWASITHSQSIALACLLVLPLLLGTNFSFGQRDHYCAILFAPYAIYIAINWAPTCNSKNKMTPATYIYLALGLAIKPYFILIWVIGESLLAIKSGKVRTILNSGNFLVVAFGILYLTFIGLFEPAYYADVLPIAISAFGEMGNNFPPQTYWVLFSISVLIIGIIYFLNLDREIKRFVFVFAVMSIAALYGFFIQSGYSYQIIPTTIFWSYSFGLMLFFMGIQVSISSRNIEQKLFHGFCKGLLLISLLTLLILDVITLRKVNNADTTLSWGGKYQTFIPQTKLLKIFPPSTTVGALSMNVFLPFPAVLYSNLNWTFTFPHLWPLPKLVMDDEFGLAKFDWFAQKIAANLEEGAPNIMLVDQHNPTTYIHAKDGSNITFNYITYLSRNADFTKAWGGYRKIGVLSHSKGRCIIIYAHKGFVLSDEISTKLQGILANPTFSCPEYNYP